MKMVTRWLSVNIHTVSEQEMLAVVYSFLQLQYSDPAFIRALEKIIKLKGCQIKEQDLMAVISNYCQVLRIRSQKII